MPRRIPTDNYHTPKDKHSWTTTQKTHISTKTQHKDVVERNHLDHGKNTSKRVHTSIVHTTKVQQAKGQ
jgi:hypothetical protein